MPGAAVPADRCHSWTGMSFATEVLHEKELETKHTVRLITAERIGAYYLPSVKDRLIQNVHKQSHSFAMHSLLQMREIQKDRTTCNHERSSVTGLMLTLTSVEPEIK